MCQGARASPGTGAPGRRPAEVRGVVTQRVRGSGRDCRRRGSSATAWTDRPTEARTGSSSIDVLPSRQGSGASWTVDHRPGLRWGLGEVRGHGGQVRAVAGPTRQTVTPGQKDVGRPVVTSSGGGTVPTGPGEGTHGRSAQMSSAVVCSRLAGPAPGPLPRRWTAHPGSAPSAGPCRPGSVRRLVLGAFPSGAGVTMQVACRPGGRARCARGRTAARATTAAGTSHRRCAPSLDPSTARRPVTCRITTLERSQPQRPRWA